MNEEDNDDKLTPDADPQIKAPTASDKQPSNETSGQLNIPTRSIIGHEIMAVVPGDNIPKAEVISSNPKLEVEPTSEHIDTPSQNDPEEVSNEVQPTKPNEDVPTADNSLLAPDQDTPNPEQTPPEPALNDTKDNQTADMKEVVTAEATENPNPDSQKPPAAIDQATNLKSLEEINNRQYFVPINAVAHNRSIKVSIVLTILFVFLSFLLIDLMLDSGTVLLLQKIPHTHFFTSSIYSGGTRSNRVIRIIL